MIVVFWPTKRSSKSLSLCFFLSICLFVSVIFLYISLLQKYIFYIVVYQYYTSIFLPSVIAFSLSLSLSLSLFDFPYLFLIDYSPLCNRYLFNCFLHVWLVGLICLFKPHYFQYSLFIGFWLFTQWEILTMANGTSIPVPIIGCLT